MFYSQYIPVDVGRNSGAIYTVKTVYPIDKLCRAYNTVSNTKVDDTVHMDDNIITFDDDPSIRWTLPEVIMAYQYYQIAEREKFSFYKVTDAFGSIHLFISKEFSCHRLIVDAFTFRTEIVASQRLRQKLSHIVDSSMDYSMAAILFESIIGIENTPKKYLDSLIIYRDTPDEMFIVSPILAPISMPFSMFSVNEYVQLMEINSGNCTETELYTLNSGIISSKSYTNEYYLLRDMDYLKKLHDSTYQTKSNYIPVVYKGTDDVAMYVASNYRYLVDATTFRIYTLHNAYITDVITHFVNEGSISNRDYITLRSLAELGD